MKSMIQKLLMTMFFFVLIIGPVGCAMVDSNQVSKATIPNNASLKEIMKLFGEKYSSEKILTAEDKELFSIAYEKTLALIEEQGFADYKLEDLNAMKANQSSNSKFSDALVVPNLSAQREQAEELVLMMFEDEKSAQLKDMLAGSSGDKIISDVEDLTKMMLLDEKSNELKTMTGGDVVITNRQGRVLIWILIICLIILLITPIVIFV